MYSLYYKIPVFFKEYVERDFPQSDSVQTTGLKKGMLKYYLKIFCICLRVFVPFLNICWIAPVQKLTLKGCKYYIVIKCKSFD